MSDDNWCPTTDPMSIAVFYGITDSRSLGNLVKAHERLAAAERELAEARGLLRLANESIDAQHGQLDEVCAERDEARRELAEALGGGRG